MGILVRLYGGLRHHTSSRLPAMDVDDGAAVADVIECLKPEAG